MVRTPKKKPLAPGDKIRIRECMYNAPWVVNSDGSIWDPFVRWSGDGCPDNIVILGPIIGTVIEVCRLSRLNEVVLRVEFPGYPHIMVCLNRDHSMYRRV